MPETGKVCPFSLDAQSSLRRARWSACSAGVSSARIRFSSISHNWRSIYKQLSRTYGEIRKGAGLAGQAALFEIWASEATGTWTILKTSPNCTACIMAVGEGWQDDPPVFTPAGLDHQPM